MTKSPSEDLERIPNPYNEDGCFFCGPTNPVGLHLEFMTAKKEPREVVCRWSPSEHYAGFGNILHGGIQSGLCDEIMGWTTLHIIRKPAVTSSITISFKKPLYVGAEIEARCRIDSIDGPKVGLSAEIRDAGGTVCTSATGTYYMIDEDAFEGLITGSSRE
jgi:uncharacterized protein (TIGR00369 family)